MKPEKLVPKPVLADLVGHERKEAMPREIEAPIEQEIFLEDIISDWQQTLLERHKREQK